MSKICSKCNIEQPISSFHKKSSGLMGVKAECKTCCSKWQSDHYYKPEIKNKRIKRQSSDAYQLYIRKFRLRTKYGISLEQYKVMLTAQDNCCNICKTTIPGGRSAKYFAIDHCHITGKIRQLLCSRCNLVLGYVKDNQILLHQMIEYLIKHSS